MRKMQNGKSSDGPPYRSASSSRGGKFPSKRGGASNHQTMRQSENPSAVPKPFGFRRLDGLSEMPGLKIMELLAVQKTMGEFVQLSNQADLKEDFMTRIVIILGKLARIEFDRIIVQLLCQISSSSFLMQLLSYVVNFNEKDLTEMDKDQIIIIFDSTAAYSHTVSKLLPTLACEKFPPILKQCKSFLTESQLDGIENVLELINITLEKIGAEKEKRKAQPVKTTVAEEACQYSLPPENFRDLSTVPMEHDLMYRHSTFLRPNITQGAYMDVEHYLDVQFRLLREDFVRPLRDGIRDYIKKKSEAASSSGNMKRIRVNNIKMYEKIDFGKAEIVEDKVGFPVNFDPMKKFCSSINWEQSKRFMHGSLLIFTKNGFETIILGKVLKRAVPDLSNGWVLVEMIVNLNDCSILNHGQWIMAESNLFFGAYSHVLEALKNFDAVNFPLKKYIVEGQNSVELPGYLQEHVDIPYVLSPKEENGIDLMNEESSLKVNLVSASWPSPSDLGLDESQYEAFKGALTQKVMLIQGPPGTGKTFLGLKVATTLLRNKEYWQNSTRMRPMVIVCYTNHALDQFLMGLSKVTSSIVRVGGGSKEKHLEKFSLRNMSRNVSVGGSLISMLKEYRFTFGKLKQDYHALETAISVIEKGDGIVDPDCLLEYGILSDRYCQSFENKEDLIQWLVGPNILALNSNDVSTLIMEEKQEEKIDSGSRANVQMRLDPTLHSLSFCLTFSKVLEMIEKGSGNVRYLQEQTLHMQHQLLRSPLTDPKHLDMNNINKLRSLKQLPTEKRWQLYRWWIDQLLKMLKNQMNTMQPKLLQAAANIKQARMVEDQSIMSKSRVIGMTTTYAASKQAILKQLCPSIVIVEEAAEVLEAHVIVSLTGSVDHLIMIGDHLQLKPNPAVYELGTKYRLNVSLFERLINNKVTCVSLTTQHRMRPEIARLVSPAIYPSLINHESVYQYPPVRGVTKNLVFIDHTHHQEEVEEIQSFRNKHEAHFISTFVRYLCLQGYRGDQITVLATYKGQMFYLNKLRSENAYLADVRVTVVDNYQGEENDIILLSLVRSNDDGDVGFLKIENRVCVALSRAKHGLFIIGNMQNLLLKGEIWPKVHKELTDMEALVCGLELQCEVHSTITVVTDADDFKNVPEGGCLLQCNSLMKCSHICGQMCHSTDRKHENFKCLEPCPRPLCVKNHSCPEKCYQLCPPCQFPTPVTLPCDHSAIIPCHLHMNPAAYKCLEIVSFTLACKHERNIKCYQKKTPDLIDCTEPCKVRLNCGHVCERKCHLFDDPDHLKYICRKPCEENNAGCLDEEGHPCKLACHQECANCVIMVKKILPCGHKWTMKCHEVPTRKVPKVVPLCGHTQMMSCGADPSSFTGCQEKCNKKLPCGHACTKKCFEACTSECQKLVPYPGVTGCGHAISIPCHKKSSLAPNSLELLKLCKEPCTVNLQPCNHQCKGTCGSCWQGNFHQACGEPCGRVNICGHSCKAPCAEKCPPCNAPCAVKCQHSECFQKCGQPCIPCAEKCLRRCAHVQCRRKCGQECIVKACEEPCTKIIRKCGHKCIGLCGDKCLCEECNEGVRDIFFGTEDDENARFIQLPDCNHIFESTALLQWLQEDTDIKEKVCPNCKTPIRTSLRYNHIILKHAYDVQMIKRKVFGTWNDISAMGRKVLTILQGQHISFPNDLQDCTFIVNMILKKIAMLQLNSRSGKKRNSWFTPKLSLNAVTSLCQYAEIMSIVARLSGKAFNSEPKLRSSFQAKVPGSSEAPPLKEEKQLEVKSFIKHFAHHLRGHDALRLSEQEASDINALLKRLDVLIELCRVESSPIYISLETGLKAKANLLSSRIRGIQLYNTKDHNNDSEVLKEIAKAVQCVITQKEIKSIVTAMGFSTGHWFKCPNGHYYAIGNCGRAVMESKCNECGAVIGGTGYQLRTGNTDAPEIFNASHPS
ncbi:NFX1-type zinc finger-containing protein 1 [Frankliniella fusca]|uniref:NFX1-type zinc finger-containing protein 1 n=1 Tax=Frankliniella fusca TaxID=407009 RepID=A0AAE1H542_9NEOP|nr:NFX1-type zinc finger-containing protein 1 [Frankliniella fusca]